MISRGQTCDWKKVVIFIIFLLLSLRWFIKPTGKYKSEQNDIQLSTDILEQPPFQGKSCVIVDGKCIPETSVNFHVPRKGLYSFNDSFFLDGRQFRILGGSFHYFRTQPAQWGDRLLKMKAAGLNTVTTYIPWNLHEKNRGNVDFSGRWDLPSFIRQVQEVDLHLIVRPGPYICAEWDFGGLPSWLLHDPNMIVRTSSYKPYLDHVARYMSHLLPLLSSYQYKKGGPIIAFQIENEFGSYGKDEQYLLFLKQLFEKYGIDELLFTSDGADNLQNGSLKDVLATVNFKGNPKSALKVLQDFQPNRPLMVTEFWAGWFDLWMGKHSVENVDQFRETVDQILSMKSSINFYMFVGGTNFEFWNGANLLLNDNLKYGPQVTSYDYDAPISEHGDITAKFHVVRNLIKKHDLGPVDWVSIPEPVKKVSYGIVYLKKHLTFESLVKLQEHKAINLEKVLPMELTTLNNGDGQGYGYILYRKILTSPLKEVTLKFIRDRANILVGGKSLGILHHNSKRNTLSLPGPIRSRHLDILVENQGRVNYKFLHDEHKGITEEILINNQSTINWIHIPFDFDDNMIKLMSTSNLWEDALPANYSLPVAHRGYLDIQLEPQDTFLSLTGWTKGLVIINGYNIGRYWNVGPQRTLYVPAPLLNTGLNEIIVFEEHNMENNFIKLVDEPLLS